MRLPLPRRKDIRMSFLIVLAALVFLMFVAYRGYSAILFAPVGGESLLGEGSVGVPPALDAPPAVLDAGAVGGFERRGTGCGRTGEHHDERACPGNRRSFQSPLL